MNFLREQFETVHIRSNPWDLQIPLRACYTYVVAPNSADHLSKFLRQKRFFAEKATRRLVSFLLT